ncbi:TetR/AcrR family transcriptional regulator [Nonomuraea sp. NPDC059023]|uniref:TetR/AcrR family transcriptional regulator n=1 Tax=unclassified Nonomuraea TaxID=2593643 RepID=UPI0036CC1CC6
MSIWFREEEPARKPRLTRERIVAAAVGLLDAEGLAGFSMRALAARLGAGTMSLYEYVRTREDVLDLALDEVFGEIDLPAPGSLPWRELLARQLARSRAVMRRHPWVPGLTATRPLAGPNALARAELFHAELARAGLSGPALSAAVGALSFYVSGFTAAENTWWALVRTPEADADIRAGLQRHLERTAHTTLATSADVENQDFDGQFALGLDVILDGIEARL